MRNTVVNTIHNFARKNKDAIFLTADLGYSVVENFQKELPEQIINVGISEQNMIGVAAGLALSGKKVFVYSIVPFVTMRCLEQIKIDVCYQNLDVTIIGIGGGFAYGTAGMTHYSIEDLGIMRSLPNLKVLSPADSVEAKILMDQVLRYKGPFYIRLGRGGEPDIYIKKNPALKIGKGFVMKNGNDCSIISIGAITECAMEAANKLDNLGVNTEIVSMHTLKPIDKDLIIKICQTKKALFALEENNILGGLGSAVAEIIAENKLNTPFKRLGVKDEYPKVVGTQEYLREINGLSPDKIAETVKNFYEKN